MIRYSTQGHVFTLERDPGALPKNRWTAVVGYCGRWEGNRPRVIATAATEDALRRECRSLAEWWNRRADLYERMNRRSS